MHNRLLRVLFSALAVLFISVASTIVLAEELKGNKNLKVAAKYISKAVSRRHLFADRITEAKTEQVLERYLLTLDPKKMFFTSADVERFENELSHHLKGFNKGQIFPAFEIANIYKQRVVQYSKLAQSLLEKGFDYSLDETYLADRAEANWLSAETLEDTWRKRVKNDVLSKRLLGESEQTIKSSLNNKYQAWERMAGSLTSNEVFAHYTNAFTHSFDPNTTHYSPRLSKRVKADLSLSLHGIGASLSLDEEMVPVVNKLIQGGAAEKSGKIQSGDRIVGVAEGVDGDMEEVAGLPLKHVTDKIRGKKGSVVRLQVLPETGQSMEVAIVRDEVNLESKAAKGKIHKTETGKKIGVIAVPTFYRDFNARSTERNYTSVTRDTKNILFDFRRSGVDGVVIDLRGNGGGSLAEAVSMVGLFIKTGPVVQTINFADEQKVYSDENPGIDYAGPLAVLVDRESASASEIFAGAIQDYKRGLVLGETTFGKGTVQSLFTLSKLASTSADLGLAKVTVSHFFRPGGQSNQLVGVEPDIDFGFTNTDVGERFRDNALEADHTDAAEYVVMELSGIDRLRKNSNERISKNTGIRFIKTSEALKANLKAARIVSLNEADRKSAWSKQEDQRISALNLFRNSVGLEHYSFQITHEDRKALKAAVLSESIAIMDDFLNPETNHSECTEVIQILCM